MNIPPYFFEDPVEELTYGYRMAQVVFTANRLGLFSCLEQQSLTAEEIALTLECDHRGIRILCDALTSLSLLVKIENHYRNSDISQKYLLPDSPHSRTAITHHNAVLYETWGQLFDVVKTGNPVNRDSLPSNLHADEKSFAAAMADLARINARETAARLDLANVKKLLDVGGGPGLYSIEFARMNPELHAVIFDNEKTAAIAMHNICIAGLQDRISTMKGNALTEPLGSGYDFIFASNLIHSFSSEENALFIQKCFSALEKGGKLCIKDFFLSSNRTDPVPNALFAVNMLVGTEGGDCYTQEQFKTWFREAGIIPDESIWLSPRSSMIIGIKPS